MLSKTPERENDFFIVRLIVFISVNLWPGVFQFGGCILTLHCLLCSRGEANFSPSCGTWIKWKYLDCWEAQRSAIKQLNQKDRAATAQERINLYIMISSSLFVHCSFMALLDSFVLRVHFSLGLSERWKQIYGSPWTEQACDQKCLILQSFLLHYSLWSLIFFCDKMWELEKIARRKSFFNYYEERVISNDTKHHRNSSFFVPTTRSVKKCKSFVNNQFNTCSIHTKVQSFTTVMGLYTFMKLQLSVHCIILHLLSYLPSPPSQMLHCGVAECRKLMHALIRLMQGSETTGGLIFVISHKPCHLLSCWVFLFWSTSMGFVWRGWKALQTFLQLFLLLCLFGKAYFMQNNAVVHTINTN